MTNVKPGQETTEFKVAQSAGVWGAVAMVLGGVIAIGSNVVDSVGNSTVTGLIVGTIVAVAGLLMKLFVSLGYIKARKEVKIVATEESEKPVGFNGGGK